MLAWMTCAALVGGAAIAAPEITAGDRHPGQLPWDRLDTVAVLGGGPTSAEPLFYRVSDAVLDDGSDILFLVNGGDGELIRYDIGEGRTSRIGRHGSGPGEFGRPLWLEPHGPDSLLVYDMSLSRFSVFSRSGDFGRTYKLRGDGPSGRHVAALTRMGTRVWAALSLGTPRGIMMVDAPTGTKFRDTVAVLEMTPEGGVSDTVTHVAHGLWRTGETSFEVIRDFYAAGATIAAGGGRLFVATFAGDALEVFAYRVGGVTDEPSGRAIGLAGLKLRGVRQVYASREGSLWIVEKADDATVFHVFSESSDTWTRQGTLTFPRAARILDASRDRAVFLHFDELDRETVVLARASG